MDLGPQRLGQRQSHRCFARTRRPDEEPRGRIRIAANLLRIFFGFSSPANSPMVRGLYFSVRDCGNASVGVLIAHPRLVAQSARCETQWLSTDVE
jgi:hypothetical protein